MRAVRIEAFGEPADVLKHVKIPEPPPPAAGEVLIGVEHAPINMNDLSLIQGAFPIRPSLPSVAGNEGVGRVLALGSDVEHLKIGDHVLIPLYSFSWRERLVMPAARLVALPHGRGCLFFTGATASLRGGIGYVAFASAKFGLRAVAQSIARELGPKNIHVAHLIIDSGVDTAWVRERIKEREGEEVLAALSPDRLMTPASVAEAYWHLYMQPRDAWTFEQEIRPFGEKW
jgi:NAD(P)-dependent dehydrogenase (short-subunit alcohol dehydrogenase family)